MDKGYKKTRSECGDGTKRGVFWICAYVYAGMPHVDGGTLNGAILLREIIGGI